ncbi:MAG TPA: hypothetical protein VLI92_01750 [Candidatus Saccharimonadales bacterium]|nr:hypothetical protein [Candidatus Saccharimonadales bacterium]
MDTNANSLAVVVRYYQIYLQCVEGSHKGSYALFDRAGSGSTRFVKDRKKASRLSWRHHPNVTDKRVARKALRALAFAFKAGNIVHFGDLNRYDKPGLKAKGG